MKCPGFFEKECQGDGIGIMAYTLDNGCVVLLCRLCYHQRTIDDKFQQIVVEEPVQQESEQVA